MGDPDKTQKCGQNAHMGAKKDFVVFFLFFRSSASTASHASLTTELHAVQCQYSATQNDKGTVLTMFV